MGNIDISADLNAVVLFGKELEFASGIRALAAEKIMREYEIADADQLFFACKDLIGEANLFESYDDPLNPYPGDLVLGEGCPFPSLEGYIALREHYGSTWVASAANTYVRLSGRKVHLGGASIEEDVKKMILRAHICFEYDMVWWTLPTRTPDGYGRYERAKRIESLNGWLAAATFKQAA